MAERFSDIEKPFVANQPSSLPETLSPGNFLFIRRKTLCVIPLQWCSRTLAGYLGQKNPLFPFPWEGGLVGIVGGSVLRPLLPVACQDYGPSAAGREARAAAACAQIRRRPGPPRLGPW